MLCPHFVSALPARNKNPLGTAAVEGDNSGEQEGALSLLLLPLPGMCWVGRARSPPSQFIQHSSITHSPGRGQGGDRSLQGQSRALGSPRGPLPGRQRPDLPEPPHPLCQLLYPPRLGSFLWYLRFLPPAFLGACDGALRTGTQTIK